MTEDARKQAWLESWNSRHPQELHAGWAYHQAAFYAGYDAGHTDLELDVAEACTCNIDPMCPRHGASGETGKRFLETASRFHKAVQEGSIVVERTHHDGPLPLERITAPVDKDGVGVKSEA